MASSLGVLRPADSDKQTVSSMMVPGSNNKPAKNDNKKLS